jgi:hypothetical protein
LLSRKMNLMPAAEARFSLLAGTKAEEENKLEVIYVGEAALQINSYGVFMSWGLVLQVLSG